MYYAESLDCGGTGGLFVVGYRPHVNKAIDSLKDKSQRSISVQ